MPHVKPRLDPQLGSKPGLHQAHIDGHVALEHGDDTVPPRSTSRPHQDAEPVVHSLAGVHNDPPGFGQPPTPGLASLGELLKATSPDFFAKASAAPPSEGDEPFDTRAAWIHDLDGPILSHGERLPPVLDLPRREPYDQQQLHDDGDHAAHSNFAQPPLTA